MNCDEILAKGKPDFTPLGTHLKHVALIARKVAEGIGISSEIAAKGAVLHDIGKAHPVFQKRLFEHPKIGDLPFRHEIASCLFISFFEKQIQPDLLDMVVAHHKSIRFDAREKGLLDLCREYEPEEVFEMHSSEWDKWSPNAIQILSDLGIQSRKISKEEAEENFYQTLAYAKKRFKEKGYSINRGLILAADHLASALVDKSTSISESLFQSPNLLFYNRSHPMYPLSLKSAKSDKPHTMVVACTGAGKTDFLLRRCKGRVFYTLPFQASINAMYYRLLKDLDSDNPGLDIRLLHSSSALAIKGKSIEEKMLQGHVGAALKVLTPHQIAGIVFGTSGYEATLIDLKGCDVILDEIHVYTDITRAIVLKIVHVLKTLGCRIHIGTATMPTVLYNQIIELLGKDNVLEVSLSKKELDAFDRHRISKIDSWDDSVSIIESAINNNEKILLVCNKVQNAQNVFTTVKDKHPGIDILLIHSRFKRGERDRLEKLLIGKDNDGKPTGKFNTSESACIVVATQVVEVSLDISFDIMITECAPLDAIIQRFGRINRVRNENTIGLIKPIYVIAPPETEKDAKPYNLDDLKASYEQLPHNDMLHEKDIQHKIDIVFPKIDMPEIEEHAIFKKDGQWTINGLTHRAKSFLLERLEIDSVGCILESDRELYENSNHDDRLKLEIPVRYWSVQRFEQLQVGNCPFVVPKTAYDNYLGLRLEALKTAKYDINNQIL